MRTSSPPAALDLLLEITVLLHDDMESSLAGAGLTRARTHLLWEVREQPLPQAELARRLAVTPRNVTALVDALDGNGLVTREAHPGDRRVQLVTLTPRGRDVVTGLARGREELAERLFGAMSSDERAGAVEVLLGLRDRLAHLGGHREP